MKKPNFRAFITLLSNNDPRGEHVVASETVIDMDSEFYPCSYILRRNLLYILYDLWFDLIPRGKARKNDGGFKAP